MQYELKYQIVDAQKEEVFFPELLITLRSYVARKPLACSYIGSMYHNFWVPLKQFTLIY